MSFFVEKFKMAPPAVLLGKKYEFSSCSSHCVTVNTSLDSGKKIEQTK